MNHEDDVSVEGELYVRGTRHADNGDVAHFFRFHSSIKERNEMFDRSIRVFNNNRAKDEEFRYRQSV